jgi:hypothetical protein
MTKATLRNARPTHAGLRNETVRRPRGNQGWARAQIRTAVEALHRDGAPLEGLTTSQIAARCGKWMRGQGMLDSEIPRPRSFERHLPTILAEVLAVDKKSISINGNQWPRAAKDPDKEREP